jgi:hypothetical protein
MFNKSKQDLKPAFKEVYRIYKGKALWFTAGMEVSGDRF